VESVEFFDVQAVTEIEPENSVRESSAIRPEKWGSVISAF